MSIITNYKKRFLNNFLALGLLRFSQEFIPIILIPYLIRIIGLKNYGLIGYALSISTLCGTIIEYGFNITATRDIARNRDTLDKLSKIFSNFFFASLYLSFLVFVIFFILISLIPRFNIFSYIYLSTIIFVIFKSLTPFWFFQGMEKMSYNTIIGGFSNLIYMLSIFSFVNQKEDFFLVPLLNAITSLITFIFSILTIKFKFRINIEFQNPIKIINTLIKGRHIFIKNSFSYVNTSIINIVTLGFFFNTTLVGLYLLTSKVIGVSLTLANLLSNTFLPFLSRHINSHIKFQKLMLSIGLFLTIITFALSDSISNLLIDENYNTLSLYIKILSLSIIFYFINLTYGTNYLDLVGKERILKNATLICSTISLALSLIIIPIYGVIGAILIPIISRIILSLTTYKIYLKYRMLI